MVSIIGYSKTNEQDDQDYILLPTDFQFNKRPLLLSSLQVLPVVGSFRNIVFAVSQCAEA